MGTILLTGANSSLALPTIRHLLTTYPTYTLLLTIRNTSPADPNTSQLLTLLATFPAAKYSLSSLDLSSLSSIASFANETHAAISTGRLPRLTTIICNAFFWSLTSGLQLSADGYERSMAVNHIGHLALTLRLLRDVEPTARIVLLSSEAHVPGKAGFEQFPPELPPPQAGLDRLVHPAGDRPGEEAGRGFQRYGLSKLAVVMGGYALQRRLEKTDSFKDVNVLALDPGGLLDSRAFDVHDVPVLWKVMIKVACWLRVVLWWAMPENMRTSGEAARDLVEMAVGEKFQGRKGHFVMNVQKDSSEASRDEKMQEMLWQKSVEWAKIGQDDTVLPL